MAQGGTWLPASGADLAARAEARKGRTPKVVFEDAAKAYPDFDEFVTALRER